MPNRISIIVVTYNSNNDIVGCLESLILHIPSAEIVVFDNNSNDGTVDTIKNRFPNVHLIINEKNIGFGAGNNYAVKKASGEYLIFINPDAKIVDNSISKLIVPLIQAARIITTPMILLSNTVDTINTCGNLNHFTGYSFMNGCLFNAKLVGDLSKPSGISGCCFAIRKVDFFKLGGFDPNFFLYNEDSDLSWKALLNDFSIKLIPSAIVIHNYNPRMTHNKYFNVELGRYIIIKKYFNLFDLILLLPSFLLTELISISLTGLLGINYLFYKFKALLALPNLKVIKQNGNYNNLFNNLIVDLPDTLLMIYPNNKKIFSIINKIYKINYNYFLKIKGESVN